MTDDKNKKPSDASGHIISVSGETDIDEDQRDQEITVHVMPKRFQTAQSSAHKSKGIGLLVIVGGIVVLMAASAFIYFYLLKPKQDVSRQESAVLDRVESEIESGTSESTTGTAAEKKEIEEGLSGEEETEDKKSGGNDDEVTATTSETVVTSVEAAAPIIVATSVSVTFETAVDSDGDGLADIEEILFDCNSQSPDSDGDGYEDLAEILNLYNPAGSGQIIINSNIEKYINSKYNYSLYYPYIWSVEEIGGKDSIIFKLTNNQFIQVIAQGNEEEETIEDWYKKQMGVKVIKSGQIVYKKGWQGVRSEDGLTVYLTKPDDGNIFIMSYNLGASNTLNYKNVFEMMVKSLEVGN